MGSNQLGVFFLCSPDCPKQAKISFPSYKFFYPNVSAKVFELTVLKYVLWTKAFFALDNGNCCNTAILTRYMLVTPCVKMKKKIEPFS